MKTKSITKISLLAVLVLSVIAAVTLNSCQKENVKPKVINTSTQSAVPGSADVTSSVVLSEVNAILFSSGKSEKGLLPKGYDASSCAVITIDTVTKPHLRSYDYGSGCVGSDGKTRAGKVSITYDNADMRLANNTITIAFQNYTVSGTTINGSIGLENLGPNANGNDVITQTGSYIGVSQGETDTMNINYQYEWLAGESSSPAANWQFSITGAIHGSSSKGSTLDINITSPLIKNGKNPTCPYYISGTQEITMGTHPVKYVDFGNPGGCSGQVAVTQNGVTTIVNQ